MFFLLITYIFLLSCRLFYLFLGTVGDRVLTAPSLNASLIFFHSSLSLSALSLSVLALSSPFISNPSLSPFTISLSSCLPPKQRVVTNVRVVAVYIKMKVPSESTLPTVKVANE